MFKVIITQRIPDEDWNGKPYNRTEHLEATFPSLGSAISFVNTVLDVVPLSSAEIRKEEEDDDRKENR